MKLRPDFTIRFNFTLMIAIGLIVLVMTMVTVVIAVQAGSRAASETAGNLFNHSTSLIEERLSHLFDDLINVATMGSAMPGAATPIRGNGGGHPDREFMMQMLATHQDLYSLYIAHKDGSFLQIINASGDEKLIETQKAPPKTAFILRAISGSGNSRTQYWTFIDSRGDTLGKRQDAKPDYDPRTRDWYKGAVATPGTFLTAPYIFNSQPVPGLTAARLIQGGQAVFAAAFTLDDLQEFIAGLEVSPTGFLLIYDQNSHLLAGSRGAAQRLGESTVVMELPGPRAKTLLASARSSRASLPREMDQWLTTFTTWNPIPSSRLNILLAAPMNDFMGPVDSMRNNLLLMALFTLAVAMPLTFLMSNRLARMLVVMAADAERIARFDFSTGLPAHSFIREFNQLSTGFSLMKATIASRSEALDTTMAELKGAMEKQEIGNKKLATLVDLGGKLSSLHDINQLCEEILKGAMDLTHAEGGSVYLRGSKETKDKLEFKIVLNNKLVGFDQGGTSGKPVTLPPVPLIDSEGHLNDHNAVTDAFHKDKTINIPNADNYAGHDLSGTRKFDQFTGYHTVSILTVPLKPLGREVIGALQLLNARNPDTGAVIPFTQEIEDLVKALAAQAATALSNQKLINDLEDLFESMIKVIVEAIDAKSPYTGGHNKRVPIIAEMLSSAASQTAEGPLAGWAEPYQNLNKQFHIAAMLHDCGKITTPEYVVDKATKLETIYNRIHEIRTRFEVLLRDAIIEHHERILDGGKKAKPAADAWLAERQKQLIDDFAFLAECNLGGEFMAPERLERLKSIANQTWIRHFDDTIGLSWEELNRIPESEKTPLPATEQLLSDKLRHRIPRAPGSLKRYEDLDFKVIIPELMYNQGEIYNLGLQRGTLTTEERFKINEHIMQTIVMLRNLCENNETLRDVVTWAGGHHETLKGTGYPYKLNAEELSTPARILAISDIFEALTAKDRPYKKAKPLSEAVKILFMFKKDGHIDPLLFDLFLTSGVYREYAEKYLDPSQIDEVDISQYVGKMA